MIDDFDPNEVRELLDGEEQPTMREQKYTFSFINNTPGLVIRADTPQEMMSSVKEIKSSWATFKEAVQGGVQTQQKEAGLSAKCQTCGEAMVKRSGITKSGPKEGQTWNALMCPNSEKGKPGHDPVWL